MKYINKMKLLLLCALVAVVIAYTEDDEEQWKLFKIEYDKVYRDNKEENSRKNIFMENLNFIQQHNKKYLNGEFTYSLGINQFADLTPQEFAKGEDTDYQFLSENKNTYEKYQFDENLELPKAVDWVNEGAVTPVKDQASCQFTRGFSLVGSLEGQLFRKTKRLISLSEQNLLDCIDRNLNCGSKYAMSQYLDYIKKNGIESSDDYKYTARKGRCNFDSKKSVTKASTLVQVFGAQSYPKPPRIKDHIEKALQHAVADVGPISVQMAVLKWKFQFYKSGVLTCPEHPPSNYTTQDMLVVGYGTDGKKQDYWRLKAPFGKKWGEDGYFRTARNKNDSCGIADETYFPII